MPWRAIATVIGWLPWSWLRLPGALLGWFTASVLRIRKAHVLNALSVAGFGKSTAIASQVYASLGTTALEFLWMAGRASQSLRPLVEIDPDDWERLRGLVEGGRGVVVATAHCGNWDLLACAVAERCPLSVVTRHMSWRAADGFWQRHRAGRGVGLLEASGALRAANRALSRGEFVAFMVDQSPERSRAVLTHPFMGAPALHDLSFALVAMRSRAPVVFAIDERLASGRHRLHMPLVLIPPERPSRAWALDACRQVSESLERHLCAHPGQWLWLHRRWKGAAADGRLPRDAQRLTLGS